MTDHITRYKYCGACGQRNAIPRPVCGRCGSLFRDDLTMDRPLSTFAGGGRTARRVALGTAILLILAFAAYALTPPRGCAIFRCGPATSPKSAKIAPLRHAHRNHGV